MNIIIVHVKRSGLTVPQEQFFNLSRSSKRYKFLSNDWTHLPLNKTKAKYQVDTVEEAIEEYSKDFSNIAQRNLKSILELYSQFESLSKQNKDIYIGCWCKDELNPKPYDHACHCDIVRNQFLKRKKILDNRINLEG